MRDDRGGASGGGAPEPPKLPESVDAMPQRDSYVPGRSVLDRLLRPLASLKLTVALLAFSIFLTFAGTVAQQESGLIDVLDRYFRTFIALIELDALTFHAFDLPPWLVLPFPGGWLLGGLLVVNLIAAHAVRFKIKQSGPVVVYGWLLVGVSVAAFAAMLAEAHFAVPAFQSYNSEMLLMLIVSMVTFAGCWFLFVKRAGIVMLHGGIIFLLLSEIITAAFAVEAHMTIVEGETVNYVEVPRAWELAVVDAGDPSVDRVTVIPESRLRRSAQRGGEPIVDPGLPFSVGVKRWLPNAEIAPPPGVAPGQMRLGDLLRGELVELKPFSGTGDEASMINLAGATLAVATPAGEPIGGGDIAVAGMLSRLNVPRVVVVDGRPYQLFLRFKRVYKPYALHLHDFVHDVYPGTNKPKDFRSIVQLTDASHGVDRRVEIYMNHPLRYRGETFFQSSFLQGDAGTVLQVVQNPGRLVPYISCLLVSVGLLGHLLFRLDAFQKRMAKS